MSNKDVLTGQAPSHAPSQDASIEELGIAKVPSSQQTKKPAELFFVWCAANIGILGVVYGAIIVSFGLSFFQSLLAAIAGVASFALVGMSSIAGKIGRTTTLTLSRSSFGKKGNIAPTSFCWINLMGWEAVNIITGTLTLAALFAALGFAETTMTTVISLILFGGLTVLVSMLGQNTVLMMQKWITRTFGAMTLFVVLYLMATADWETIMALPSGSWITGFLPAVSIIAAGTGISWAIAGADYSRDQSPSSSHQGIFNSVVGGAALPLIMLMLTGILLTAQIPDLASHENPISAIGRLLPSWMAVPYLAAAVAGIVTIAVLSLYSASLNLLSMGIKLKQRTAVALDAVLVLGVALYVLFVSGDFLGPFISFLVFCGVFLAAWAAIFMTDFFTKHRYSGYSDEELFGDTGTNKPTLACWVVGSLSGLMVSNTGFIDGPFAVGIFADSSLGLFISFLVSMVLYRLTLKKNA
ncbi:cytosine permease (plasmid) [Photobacterium sp. DA100]|uniref:purine-cytosine permease family protein n=1 Tax=Photobacterium sp. DA100 TaxID=3027472 RepID=UPI00247ABD05|nr:cytosine permease [Photobacterium sp. DA100]WEM44853.1 cytosine permease [Photobacterium sp. DA100]